MLVNSWRNNGNLGFFAYTPRPHSGRIYRPLIALRRKPMKFLDGLAMLLSNRQEAVRSDKERLVNQTPVQSYSVFLFPCRDVNTNLSKRFSKNPPCDPLKTKAFPVCKTPIDKGTLYNIYCWYESTPRCHLRPRLNP